MEKDMKNPWVFVDDSDPGITFSGPWVVGTGIKTGLDSLTDPDSLNTPSYGTVHSTSGNSGDVPYQFWYQFNGTDFLVMFRGDNGDIIVNAKCTIDGVQQVFVPFMGPGPGWVIWYNSKPLTPTSHKLSITLPNNVHATSMTEEVLSFDWLAYNPLSVPEGDADILYSMSSTNSTPITFSFQFNGISAGIYGQIGEDGRPISSNGTTACSLFSYSVDSSLPVNVTLEAQIKPLESSNYPQLLLQTPLMCGRPSEW